MSDYDDEILFLEDYGESGDGTSIWTIRASFADGTTLTAQAKIHMPPPEELTPQEVEYYDPIRGETVTESDEGQTEAWELETKTTAYRLLDQIRALITRIPERPKQECPVCNGNMVCHLCDGVGCVGCEETGVCSECDGRGLIFTEQ
jgi:hypothetical protein